MTVGQHVGAVQVEYQRVSNNNNVEMDTDCAMNEEYLYDDDQHDGIENELGVYLNQRDTPTPFLLENKQFLSEEHYGEGEQVVQLTMRQVYTSTSYIQTTNTIHTDAGVQHPETAESSTNEYYVFPSNADSNHKRLLVSAAIGQMEQAIKSEPSDSLSTGFGQPGSSYSTGIISLRITIKNIKQLYHRECILLKYII